MANLLSERLAKEAAAATTDAPVIAIFGGTADNYETIRMLADAGRLGARATVVWSPGKSTA